jgi:hypothetical protein
VIEVRFSKSSGRVDVSLSPEDGHFQFHNIVLSSIQNSERWIKSRNPIIPEREPDVSETGSVFPEDCILDSHRRENLKFC